MCKNVLLREDYCHFIVLLVARKLQANRANGTTHEIQ